MSLKTELVLALPRSAVIERLCDALVLDRAWVLEIGPFCRAIGKHLIIGPRYQFEKGGPLAETHVHFASYVTVMAPPEEGETISQRDVETLANELSDPNKDVKDVYNKHVKDLDGMPSRQHTHLLYSRTSAGGEAMLHGATSIGFGGHVNPAGWVDMDSEEKLGEWLEHCLKEGAAKELSEEILGEDWGDSQLQLTHVVWDISNEVGRYHLAALGVLVDDKFHEREQQEVEVALMDPIVVENTGGEWSISGEENPQEGEHPAQRLESWSRILLDQIATNVIDIKP